MGSKLAVRLRESNEGCRAVPDQLDDLSEATQAEQAYRRLEEMIVTLELAPGEVLAEAALARRLKFGRTPIREALQRLARGSLVKILPRKGIFVSELDVKSQVELLRVRRELERLMARYAAKRSTTVEREALVELAQGMERCMESDDVMEFMRLDDRLNQMMADNCRNDFAKQAMTPMHALSRRFWFKHYTETFDLPLCARLHADLAYAIVGGNPQRAAEASDKLLDYIESFTRATLEESPSGRIGSASG